MASDILLSGKIDASHHRVVVLGASIFMWLLKIDVTPRMKSELKSELKASDLIN